ncbi:MAG: SRPBCC family protein [Nitrospiria bacterium]
MKLLKKAAVAVLVTLLLVGGVALSMPASTRLSRFIVIDRDIETVFAMVNDQHKFNQWSPWARIDPVTRYEYSGPESGVGAKLYWRSRHRKVGRGSREIVESLPNERVDLNLRFGRRGRARTSFILVKQNQGTGLTWLFHIEHGKNLVSRFFGPMLDTWVGEDYEAGLQNLKALLENKKDG